MGCLSGAWIKVSVRLLAFLQPSSISSTSVTTAFLTPNVVATQGEACLLVWCAYSVIMVYKCSVKMLDLTLTLVEECRADSKAMSRGWRNQSSGCHHRQLSSRSHGSAVGQSPHPFFPATLWRPFCQRDKQLDVRTFDEGHQRQ